MCAALWLAAGTAAAEPQIEVATLLHEAASPTQHVGALTIAPEVDAVRSRLPNGEPLPMSVGGRAATELAGVNYRIWMGRGGTQMGVGVGTLGFVQPRPDGRIDGPLSLAGASPTISVGMRQKLTRDATVYADAYGTRGLGGNLNDGYVDTKVGLEWKQAKSRFGIDHGALGIHLDSGYRLALRARQGGLGLYLRSQF